MFYRSQDQLIFDADGFTLIYDLVLSLTQLDYVVI